MPVPWPRPAWLALSAGLMVAASHVAAAPLDGLLSADAPRTVAGRIGWQLEASRDLANDRLDVLGLRSASGLSGTTIGNYAGQHLRLHAGTDRWQVDAAWWRRRIEDRDTPHRFDSWQVAGQHRLGVDETGPMRWAVRFGAWGSQSGQLSRRTGAALAGGGLDSQLSEVRVLAPRDRQFQADLIGTRAWSSLGGLTGSAFVGLGSSRVGNRGVQGSATVAGCPYTLDFGAERLTASPASPCPDALTLSVPNGLLPYDALRESNYGARLVHVGGSLRWPGDGWSLAVGYSLERWRRDIDALVRSRGLAGQQRNQTWIGEWQVDIAPHVAVVLRGQLMQHQFLGELPLAYNPLTVSRFSQRYGLVGAGLIARF